MSKLLLAGQPIDVVARRLSDMYRPNHWWQIKQWWWWRHHAQPDMIEAKIALLVVGEAEPLRHYGVMFSGD